MHEKDLLLKKFNEAGFSKEQSVALVNAEVSDIEYAKFLTSPELFKIITEQELDKRIVGEIESRKTIFLVAQGRLVENKNATSDNLCVNDESGSGKDYVVKNTLAILPRAFYFHRTKITPEAFTYWHDGNSEPDWTWMGKVVYLEDISSTILNCDTFKVMSSGGSNSTIVSNQKAIDIPIAGKPSMIITYAASNPKPELLRRFPILDLDTSKKQTKEIMKRHAKFALEGKTTDYNERVTNALSFLEIVSVKVPFAEKIVEYLPEDNLIMRTQFSRFLDYIKFSAAFHQFQREQDKDGFILAQGQDYSIARKALLKTVSNQFMLPLTKTQKRLLTIMEKLGNDLTFKEIEAKVSFVGKTSLYTLLNNLDEFGFIKKQSATSEEGRPSMLYSFVGTQKIKIPTWEDIDGRNIEKTESSETTENVETTGKRGVNSVVSVNSAFFESKEAPK